MASSSHVSPYDPIYREDPVRKPTATIRMSTFSPSADTITTDYASGSQNRSLSRQNSDTSSENAGSKPRFASWRPSFFQKRDRERFVSWKPVTLKNTFLIFMFLVTVALIVVLEVLNQKGAKDDGLIFAHTRYGFTAWETFCYRYLPTILAVIYGMVWAVLDLDVKRLEPFFQLSKLEGVSSKDSILLNYPFEFLAYVPIAGFRRRHWPVFLSGLALLITFWVITPLQSAILATQIIYRKIPTSFITRNEFIPFEKHRALLTTEFEYTAYGVVWLGEQLQPFLTKEYMALPFKPLNWDTNHVDNGGNESWTVSTRAYSTNVDCKPAANTFYLAVNYTWAATNEEDTCTMGFSSISSGTRNMMYYGVHVEKGLDSRTFISGCRDDPNLFIGVWGQSSNEDTPEEEQEFSVIFCRSSYFYADTVVTVDGTTLGITNPQRIESSENSTTFTQEDGIIDIETIEMNMLSIGQMSQGEPYLVRIGPSSTQRFVNWNLTDPSRMMGYIIGSADGHSFSDFQDPEIFSKAVQKAHRLLFSNALNYLLQPISEPNPNTAPVIGTRSVRGTSVIMVPELVYILEACFAIVALCLVIIFVLYRNRRNNLFSDPASLAAKMSLVADSKPLLEDFGGLDDCPKLDKCLSDRKYRLDVWADGTEHYRLDRIHDSYNAVPAKVHHTHASQHTGAGVMPLELRLWVGVTLTTTLFGLLVLLCILYKSNLKYNGLPTLSDSQIGVQIIFSFIPTIIATVIEPLWVLITRSICAYQPYIALHKGNASISSSLSLKYTNIPSALVLPRALRDGNFLVSSLSAVTLLANFLAVALSGLFENVYLPLPGPYTFTQSLQPLLNAKLQYSEEQYMLANTNITSGTALPPFVSPEFYFLPFTWDTTAGRNSSDLHTGITRGFGGNVTCQPLETENFNLRYFTPRRLETGSERYAPDRYWANNFNITVPRTGGTGNVDCSAYPVSRPNQKIFWTKSLVEPPGPAAGEYMLDLEPTDPDADQDTWDACLSILILGWARGTISYSNHGNYNFSFIPGTFENRTLVCQQDLFSAEFEVVVDGSQRVHSYNRVSNFDYNNQLSFQNNSLTNFTAQVGRLFMAGSSVGGTNDDLYNTKEFDESMDEAKWHNDSTPVLFPHLLIGTLLNNTKLADPTTPVPEFDLLSKGFQDLYSRLFALSLSLNSDRTFAPAATNISISGTTTTEHQRISMSKDMFLITAVLLGINVVVGITAWIWRPKRLLPRFPDNIASEIGFFYASQALRDVSGTVSMSSRAREKHLEGLGHKYGYGVYIGEDGRRHRGVERQSLLDRNDEYNVQQSII